jgi:nucleotide-binding universal stress UspA family protein
MYNHILVPISFDEEDKTERALALTRLLGSETARVTLLHVMERVPVYAISYIPDDYLNESRGTIERDLEARAATLPNASAAVIDGHAGSGILEWLEENDVDCVIIASHDPGVTDYFLGGTAAHVVRHAKCSVHVVR